MSKLDDLLAIVVARKLRVSNLYEGTDGIWRCFLRKRNSAHTHFNQGRGDTMETALRAALYKPLEDLL